MLRTLRIGQALLLALALVVSSCGGGGGDTEAEPVADATSGQEAPAEDVVPSPPMEFDDMAHEDQLAWMQDEVVPHMTTMFQEFDAERYASVNCATCHGPGAIEGEFDMPSNSLPALPATGTPEQQQMVDQYTEMATFMFQEVLPTMQTLLGEEAFDEETGHGFSCYACHPHAGDEGSTLIELSAGE